MNQTKSTNLITDEHSDSVASQASSSESIPASRIPGFPFLSLFTLAISGCLVLYGHYYAGRRLPFDYSLLVSGNELAIIKDTENMEPAKAEVAINRQVIIFERLLATSLEPNRLLEYHQFLTHAVAQLERFPNQSAPEISSFQRRTRGRIDEILLLMRQSESSNARAYAKFFSAQRMLFSIPLSVEQLNAISAELNAAATEVSQEGHDAKKSKFPVETMRSIRDLAQWLSKNQKCFTVDSTDPFSFYIDKASKIELESEGSSSGRLYREIQKDLSALELSIAEFNHSNSEQPQTQTQTQSSSPLSWQASKNPREDEMLLFRQLDQLDSHIEYSDWSSFTEVLGEIFEAQPHAQQHFTRQLCIAMLLRVCLETDGPRSGRDLARAGELCFQLGAGTPKVNALLFCTANSTSQVHRQLSNFRSALDSEPGNPCTLITKVIQLGLAGQYTEAEQTLDSMVLVAPDTIPQIASVALWRASDVLRKNTAAHESPEPWLKLLKLINHRTAPMQSTEYARLRWLIIGSRFKDALREAGQLSESYPDAAWIGQVIEEANQKTRDSSSGVTSPKIDQHIPEATQIGDKQ